MPQSSGGFARTLEFALERVLEPARDRWDLNPRSSGLPVTRGRRSPMSYPGFPHPYNPVIAVVIWTTVPLAVLVSSSRDKKPMDADLEASCYAGFQAIPRRSVVTPV